MEKPKILVILGPTASGKSDLAVMIAKILESKKFKKIGLDGAEIISADSRQVYKRLDIGTGKITPDAKNFSNFGTGQTKKKYVFTHQGIPHFLIDVVNPKTRFTASDFKKRGEEAIEEILNKNKLPIICGGTGFYIDALLGEKVIPEVPPNPELRKELEQKTAEELFKILQKLDPVRAKNIDAKNPRRLVRAIEIAKALGKAPRAKSGIIKYEICKIGVAPQKEITLPHPSLILKESKKGKGFILDENELKKRINKRIEKWFKQDLIKEVQNLHRKGLSWKRMSEIGLEYKLVAMYLQKEISEEELVQRMQVETWQYAKRQMTWFKKDKSVIWLPPKIKLVEEEVIKFLYH